MFATLQNYASQLNWQQGLIQDIVKPKNFITKVNTNNFKDYLNIQAVYIKERVKKEIG